jgi:poly(A) polymerase
VPTARIAPTRVDLRRPDGAQEEALAAMVRVPAVADELGQRFAAAGHDLYLVGGSVRDLLLGRAEGSPDLDFTTDATPEQVLALARGWADAVFELGLAFGTVGLVKDDLRLEVTTYRTESYDRDSRKPRVEWGTSLDTDLLRRDFTVNAMAVSVPGHVFVDLFGGLRDLAAGVLRTPGPPEDSFTDDPLRILRAARFLVQLSRPERAFTVAPEVTAAATALADRIAVVSPERVRDELSRLLVAPDPVPGLEFVVDTGIAAHVLPELPRMRMESDPLHRHKDVYLHSLAVLRNAVANEHRLPDGGPDLVVRMAALLHDIAKPDTRKFEPGGGVSFHHHEVVGAKLTRRRLQALRYDKRFTADVEQLVRLHLRFHGYKPEAGKAADSVWSDSAVRRYVTDAGPLLERLHVLVRSDCTTRNERKARLLARSYDDLEDRIAQLREKEELAEAAKPDLDGVEIMNLLGIGPGPLVGEVRAMLSARKLEEGPLAPEVARELVLAWGREHGFPA